MTFTDIGRKWILEGIRVVLFAMSLHTISDDSCLCMQPLNLWPLECLVWKQLHSHHIRELLWRCIVEHLWDKVDTTGVWCATRHLSLFTILKVQEVQPQKSKILGRDMFLKADRLSGTMPLLLKQEYMGVSKPRGTLKWMVLENPYSNGWFGGTPPYFRKNIHVPPIPFRFYQAFWQIGLDVFLQPPPLYWFPRMVPNKK